MKKILISIIITCSIFSLLTAETKDNLEIKFIKGNISDKITCVKDADENISEKLSVKAIDFVLENMDLLKDDRELSGLAIAAIMTFPENVFIEKTEETITKFSSIFYRFTDKNVRISVLEKLTSFSEKSSHNDIITFINTFLQETAAENKKVSEVEKCAVNCLSTIGNSDSFNILFTLYINKKWSSLDKELNNAIISLTEVSMNELISIINNSDYTQMKLIQSIFVKNDKISESLKSEIGEKLLNSSMLIVRDSGSVTKDISDFQFELCKVLYDNNWTRSSSLMLSYFDVAKTEQKAGFITENQFAEIIRYIEKLSSKEAVKIFVSYLESLNAEMNDNKLPSVTIVSALISALGDLGDKSAFDCLLYTTYLNYPEEIISQARSALSSLKW